MSSRTEQKEKRRQEILEAGLDLFIRKGYAATQITDIAQQVGMSRGLMFHYFESKEMLYEALIQLGISGPQNVMPTPISETQPIAYFENVAEQLFCTIKSQAFTAKMFVLMSQALHSESVPVTVQELLPQTDIITPSIQLIIAGQKNKTIREGDPRALAIAYWSAIQGVAVTVAFQPDLPCPQADWIVDILRRKPK